MNARYWPCLGVKLFAGAIRRTSDSAVRLCLEPRGGTDECTLPRRTQPSRARRTHGAPERRHAARKLKRAQILLAADAGAGDEDIAISVGVGGSTVYRTKRRFLVGNLEEALSEEPRPGASRKLSGKDEALLIADRLFQPTGGWRPLVRG